MTAGIVWVCVWAMQGERRLKCDSGLSRTIRLNTLVYRLDGDSSWQHWLSLTHSQAFTHFSFIPLNIPWNQTAKLIPWWKITQPASSEIWTLLLFLNPDVHDSACTLTHTHTSSVFSNSSNCYFQYSRIFSCDCTVHCLNCSLQPGGVTW